MILLSITWLIGFLIAISAVFTIFFKKKANNRMRFRGFICFMLGCGIIMVAPNIFDELISDTVLVESKTLEYDLQKLSGVNLFYQESKNDYIVKLSKEDLKELKEHSSKHEQYNYQVMQETYLKINKDTIEVKKSNTKKNKLIIQQEIYLKQYSKFFPDKEENKIKYTISI